ncbi:hypothetical protein ACIBJE_02425 [Micromonospora sp. NPDC050187]|uniref:hypothetical protein n=1 Tax=Micromonospora sp. NPDC050187 TaxID=3364277 RepID=UPI0037B92A82
MSRTRARALALVLVVFLTVCSDNTEPAAAPSSSSADDRWACRKLKADLMKPPDTSHDNAAIGSPLRSPRTLIPGMPVMSWWPP